MKGAVSAQKVPLALEIERRELLGGTKNSVLPEIEAILMIFLEMHTKEN